jgi:flagellar FliJ protein
MARFNFRLQQFLSIKEQIENQKEIEYGQALRKLEEEKQRLILLCQYKESQIESFRQSLANVIDTKEGRRYNNTIERLKQRIKEQAQRVAAAEDFAEKKRLELVEAMKERKALESVKENAFETYTLEEKLTEKRQVDELVSYQYRVKEGS